MLDKEEIKKMLQQNRDNPSVKKENWTTVQVGIPVQVAKKGSVFYENLIVVRNENGKWAIVQYNDRLPKVFDLSKDSKDNTIKVSLVNRITADIVEDAIDTWMQYQHYHINAYNFIMVYCLVKGVDLVRSEILEV